MSAVGLRNLYFFRNMIHGKVIISTESRVSTPLLSQIGEHRSCRVIRPDHWLPFLVVHGLPSESAMTSLLTKVKTEIKHPQGKYRLPLPSQQMDAWTVPSPLKEKVKLLCTTLSDMESSPESMKENESSLTDAGLTLFWERDDYAPIVYSEGLEWPSFVRHEKMELAQNRVPLVPGVSHPKNPFMVTDSQVPAQQQASA